MNKSNNYRFLKNIFLLKKSIPLLFAYLYDWKYYIKHSFSVLKSNSKDKEKALLMLYYHALEKGLSFPNPKENYGADKALYLLDFSDNYYNKYGSDRELLTALDVLQEYYDNTRLKRWTGNNKIQNFQKRWINFQKKEQIDTSRKKMGGTKIVSLKEQAISFEDLKNFTSTRYSVRNFSQTKEINRKAIEDAVKIAQSSPSVCNRQTSRVHVYYNKNCDEIIENQLGDQGWTKQANRLFIITSNTNYFSGIAERKQPFIDGGMFAMLFLLGLHGQQIATCCKMFVREPNLEKKFHAITNIPENEIPIMIILAGHYQDDTVKIPCSNRLETTSVLIDH